MPFSLYVDRDRWQEHLRAFLSKCPGVVPVIKGNGYGFGRELLAKQAAELQVPCVAVGTYDEIDSVRRAYDGDLLVLSPWRPFLDAPLADEQVIHTVSRASDLDQLAGSGARIVVEVMTSMRRHGIQRDEVTEAAARLSGLRFEGWALHLPFGPGAVPEAVELADRLRTAREAPVWASHIPPERLAELGPDARLRSGTALWLGDPGSRQVRGTVLDVHQVHRGDRFGYYQSRAPGDGYLVVITGGTMHGVALEPPRPAGSFRQRAQSVARGGLEAVGRTLSPFTIDGRKRWFAEPPHMQCSLIWLPESVSPPAVGDEVPARIRYPLATFDRVVFE